MAARADVRTLRLHLCPLAELRADAVLRYELLDAGRRVLDSGAQVPAALPRAPRVEWVIAASDVLLLDVTLPRVSGARLRAALGPLAEPLLIGDLEQAYIAASPADAGRRATLAVLDRALFKRALELFARLDSRPASATPEPLTLDLAPGTWRLRWQPGGGCVRSGARLGFACGAAPDGEPPTELQLALAQAGASKPRALEVEGECDAAAWSESLGVAVRRVTAQGGRAAPVVLELLQEEFAPRIADWRVWRVPAYFAAALLVVSLVGLNTEAVMMRGEAHALRARMTAAYRGAFPKVQTVLDPVAQMRRGVAELRAGAGTGDPGDFLPLAAGVAQALGPDGDAVRAIEYRDGTLHVRFDPRAIDSAQKREAIDARVTKAGYSARFSDTTLTLRREGSP